MSADDLGEYCRAIEHYLTRKNDGHLIRIRGPVFEQVAGWATRGIPLTLVQQGIDRYFERYYAKGPRRRPVQIEFCEADVLDVFDEWRKAVGLPQAGGASGAGEAGGPSGAGEAGGPSGAGEAGRSRRAGAAEGGPAGGSASLPAHLERVIARLTAMRAGGDRSLDANIDAVVQELDAARAQAKSARGDAREALLARLHELDAVLLAALRERCDAQTRQRLEAEADEELRPYKPRMPAEAYRESHRAAVDRLLRERARLPRICYE